MISVAVKIDNRLYERSMEKKGHFFGQGNKKSKGKGGSYWPQPIELDATFQRKLPKEEMDRRRKLKLCFTYRKEGHRADFYKKGFKKGNRYKKEANTTSRSGYNRPMEVCGLGSSSKGKERTREERRQSRKDRYRKEIEDAIEEETTRT